jgi:hypothetical protein
MDLLGLSDRRMMPLLRPGSTVLIDTTLRRIDDADWSNEYDRPMYFVEIRNGYRCGWFQKDKWRLIMQPHTLSRCAPEAWLTPDGRKLWGKWWEWSVIWASRGRIALQQFQKDGQIGTVKLSETAGSPGRYPLGASLAAA